MTIRIQAITRPEETFLHLMVFSSKRKVEGLERILDALIARCEEARCPPEIVMAIDRIGPDPSSILEGSGTGTWYSGSRWSNGAMALTFVLFALVFFYGVWLVLENGHGGEDVLDLGYGLVFTQLLIAIAWVMSLAWFECLHQGIAHEHSRTFTVDTEHAQKTLARSLDRHGVKYSTCKHIDSSAREVHRFHLEATGGGRTFIDLRFRPSPGRIRSTDVTIGTTSSHRRINPLKLLVERTMLDGSDGCFPNRPSTDSR